MTTRTTRLVAALASGALLVVGANTLTSSSQAAPGADAPAASVTSDRAGSGATLRVRPGFGGTINADTPEYFTVKLPKSGNYNVTMRGFMNYTTSPISTQCLVVDKQKILANNVSGFYLVSFSDSDAQYDFGLNESIDVDLKASRPLLVGCASDEDVSIIKPITITFKRNGAFTNLNAKPYTIPVGFKLQRPLG